MSVKGTFILTVPHAKCPYNTVSRKCDLVAKRAANALQDALETRTHEVILHVADLERKICDENRYECRNTDFRKKLRKIYEKTKTVKRRAVIDVHSYPGTHKEWLKYHVVVLDKPKVIGGYIVDSLEEKGISVYRILLNSATNDIMEESWVDFGIPSILIEFNERLTQSQIENTCAVLALALEKHVNEYIYI